MQKEIDRVIYLVAPDEEITRRMLARGRTDDTEEVILNRLDVYRTETEPVLQYYQNRGLAVEVNGLGTVDEVHQRVFDATRVGAES